MQLKVMESLMSNDIIIFIFYIDSGGESSR